MTIFMTIVITVFKQKNPVLFLTYGLLIREKSGVL